MSNPNFSEVFSDIAREREIDEEAKRSAEVERLRSALRGLVLVCGPTGDSMTDFEEQAEAFYRETGYMRPGKDFPAAGDPERANHEMRHDRYVAWWQSKVQAGRDALKPEEGDGPNG